MILKKKLIPIKLNIKKKINENIYNNILHPIYINYIINTKLKKKVIL
jgi:hypothetical protein